MLEIPYFGNEDGVMDKKSERGRRTSATEKGATVRMVPTLRAEPGTERGTVQRVALQLRYWWGRFGRRYGRRTLTTV